MPKFRFVGESRTVFPSIVLVDHGVHSVLEVDPGDIVDLPTNPGHPELVPVTGAAKPARKAPAKRTAAPKPPTSTPVDKTEE